MNHEPGENCHCSPTVIPVKCRDGSIGWVAAHHEPNQTPEQEAQRAASIFEAIEQVYLND